jgi:hypothetical protein
VSGGVSLKDNPEVAEGIKKPGDTHTLPGFLIELGLTRGEPGAKELIIKTLGTCR